MRLWLKISLSLLTLALCAWGFSRLRLEADILTTLPQELPEVRGLQQLRKTFKGGDDLVVALKSSDVDGVLTVTETLAAKLAQNSRLVSRVRTQGTFEDPAQAGALLAWALQNSDPAQLLSLKERLGASALPEHLAGVVEKLASDPDPAVVQQWAYDPLGLLEVLGASALEDMQNSGFTLGSQDGTFRIIFVSPAQDLSGYREAAVWMDEIRQIIAESVPSDPSTISVHLTGEPAFVAETGQGIEKDMRNTIGLTEVLIALLFWVMFRRLKPLLWIQLLLVLVMVLTLAFAGLILGSVSVMSLGFAAIVLGIVVDYAVLILQEAHDHPNLSASSLRRIAAPGIISGACTTAVVFLSLIFAGLPGLANLGVLVAIGVLVGLGVMLGLAPYFVRRADQMAPTLLAKPGHTRHGSAKVFTTSLLVVVVGVLGFAGLPAFQKGPEALRPSRSNALDAWKLVEENLGKDHRATVPLLVTGTAATLRSRAREAQILLARTKTEGTILDHALPAVLVADPQAQASNKSVAQWMAQEQVRIKAQVADAGFTEGALQLYAQVLSAWQQSPPERWPQSVHSTAAEDVVARFTSVPSDVNAEAVLLGAVTVDGQPGNPNLAALEALQQRLQDTPHIHLTGWESLGMAMSRVVQRDILQLTLPLFVLLVLMLLVIFRRMWDIALLVLVLALGIASLCATMVLTGLSWNLASLAALPLLLGTGIDYGIHIMLALQRSNNDIARVHATTARAVFFSGMTTVIAFSSLIFAGNHGVASLGIACCVGTAWILLFVVWLLPYWRAWTLRRSAGSVDPE